MDGSTASLLAQTSPASSIWFWSLVLLGFIFVAMGVVYWVRRRLSPNEDFSGDGFTLSDLRNLHKSGQMSDEEYDKAKSLIVGAAKAVVDKDADAKRAARQKMIDDLAVSKDLKQRKPQ